MHIKVNTSLTLLAIGFAQNAMACDKPEDISIPDGSQASEQEMASAGKAYHEFMIGMQRYQVCLENAANQDRLSATTKSKADIKAEEDKYASLHNAASASMKKTTESFDDAVAAYKARQ